MDIEPDEYSQAGSIRLKEEIDLNSVLTGATFEINFDDLNLDKDGYNPKDVDVAEFSGAYLDLDSDDEDESDTSTPFEKLAKKMTNVTEDGKIKKLLKHEGVGITPTDHALVSVYYSTYLEYNDEPTDFAFIKKPYQFRLGYAGIHGMDYAVQTMKANEKAWFLIHPDYAFGKMGHPPRIPQNATFLFQIEMIRFVDSGPALQLNKLTTEEKRQFPIAYKTASALLEHGREYFKNNLKLCIREYNKAVTLMEECTLGDMDDQEKQQKLLFKLYSNLAVCYTKDSNPRRACTMCNQIFSMAKNTSIHIPAKVYFHNGRALIMLGEYKRAKEKLLRAQKLEPMNKEISNELAKVCAKMAEEEKRERLYAKALIQGEEKKKTEEVIEDNFRIEIRNLCTVLKGDDTETQFKLPSGLTEKECDSAKNVAEKMDLFFKETSHDGKLVYYISKTEI